MNRLIECPHCGTDTPPMFRASALLDPPSFTLDGDGRAMLLPGDAKLMTGEPGICRECSFEGRLGSFGIGRTDQ